MQSLRKKEDQAAVRDKIEEMYNKSFTSQIGSYAQTAEMLEGDEEREFCLPPSANTRLKQWFIHHYNIQKTFEVPFDVFDCRVLPQPHLEEPELPQQRQRRNDTREGNLQFEIAAIDEFKNFIDEFKLSRSDSAKNRLFKKFWEKEIYTRALDIWDNQAVLTSLNETPVDAIEIEDSNKLTFTFLKKKNRKHQWIIKNYD